MLVILPHAEFGHNNFSGFTLGEIELGAPGFDLCGGHNGLCSLKDWVLISLNLSVTKSIASKEIIVLPTTSAVKHKSAVTNSQGGIECSGAVNNILFKMKSDFIKSSLL